MPLMVMWMDIPHWELPMLLLLHVSYRLCLLYPTGCDDRALPKILRRAVRLAVCLPAQLLGSTERRQMPDRYHGMGDPGLLPQSPSALKAPSLIPAGRGNPGPVPLDQRGHSLPLPVGRVTGSIPTFAFPPIVPEIISTQPQQ